MNFLKISIFFSECDSGGLVGLFHKYHGDILTGEVRGQISGHQSLLRVFWVFLSLIKVMIQVQIFMKILNSPDMVKSIDGSKMEKRPRKEFFKK